MTKKIFRSIFTASLTALIICLIFVTGVLYEHFSGIQKSRLESELLLASSAVELDGMIYLKAVQTDGSRLTWIAADGTVLFDTDTDASAMENHADREEVSQALQTGSGSSERYSSTATRKTIYRAVRLSDGTVLRISVENTTVFSLVAGMVQPLLIILIFIVILSYVLAGRMAKNIVDPLNTVDLDHPLKNDAYEELSPFLRRIDELHRQVDAQVAELRKKTAEFEQVTGSMSEGLVLLDGRENVVSINKAAMKLFHADGSCVGKDFITVERAIGINDSIRSAMTYGHSEIRAELDGREYQIDISRTDTDGGAAGAVLLAFDVTEKLFAERNRREFTANVSHELKTPLQSISGSAELMENGLVKKEDMPRFIGYIRTEASRLITLIDDIIRLSQLDENTEMPLEGVDLYQLAQETKSQLSYASKTKNILFEVTGESTEVYGVRKLLGEMICNLCDNSVKYGFSGGHVNVDVRSTGGDAIITVSDDGMGIPAEHQERIFERFYRVDKSHSRESGGTGLGLSIVKHAVMYHHGTVTVASEPGKGSVFTVKLPLRKNA